MENSRGECPCPGVLGESLEALRSHSGSSGEPAEPPRWGLTTAPSQGKTFCAQFPNKSTDWTHKPQRNSLDPDGNSGMHPWDQFLDKIPIFRVGIFQKFLVSTSQNFFVSASQSLPDSGQREFASSLPWMAPFGVSPQKNHKFPPSIDVSNVFLLLPSSFELHFMEAEISETASGFDILAAGSGLKALWFSKQHKKI